LVDLLYLLDEVEARQCEASFAAFVRAAWPVLEPGTDLEWNWHYDVLCEKLQAAVERVAAGKPKDHDLIVNVPPRSLKSTIVTVMLPAWSWIRWPRLRWLTTSYSDSLALEHSWTTRRLIMSEWYTDYWSSRFSLMGDQNVKNFYANDRTGYRISAGRGGTATGRGGDIIVADDPQSAEEGESESSRLSVISWWTKTMHSRLNDQRVGLRIVIQQRLHENDLTGYLLENQPTQYEHLKLPAELAADPRPVELAARYEDGLLDPRRFGREMLDQIRARTSSYIYEGQYNQRPVSSEGGLFKRNYWGYWKPAGMALPPVQRRLFDGRVFTHKLVDLPDEFDNKLVAWDAAFKGTAGSDRCAGDVWGINGADEYLLDEDCGNYDFLEFVEHVVALYERHRDAYYVVIEDAANGPAAISTLEDRIPCLVSVHAEGSKTSRATDSSRAVSFLARAEAGHCYLPHPAIAAWVDDWVDELASFPKGKHDDRVDASVHAHRKLTEALPGVVFA